MAETTKPTNKERLQEITAGIEQGIKELFESDRYMAYLRTMSRFHSYSVNNQMLIHMQMPGATRVAGFNKWKNQFERHVKKGEHGIKIIAPTPFKKKIEEMKLDPDTRLPVLDREGRAVMEEKEVEIPMFRPVTVFDVSQTEGKPLPQLATDLHGDVKHYEIFMEALLRSSPVPMAFEQMEGMDGYFSEEQQRVAICEGMSEVQTVCAAVHEITHAKLHNYEKARLEAAKGHETKKPQKPKDRATEEVEAESVSYAVCQYYGIETGSNSFGYIATWSNGRELPELRASLETISKTASGLITDIDGHFRNICKERGIDLSALEQTEPEADTMEQFAADLCDYMDNLQQAGFMDHPYALEPREQTIKDIVSELRQGDFQDFRYLLNNINLPSALDLLDRLDHLEQERDTSLVFKMEANPRATGLNDRHFIQAYEPTEEATLIPREVVYVGSPDECRGLLARLEDGSVALADVRAYEREKAGLPPLRDEADKNGKTPEEMTDQDVLLSMADTDLRLFGQVTEATQGVMEKSGYQYENGALVTMPDKEAVFLLDNHMYLYIQDSEDGYDYTLYEKPSLRVYDGGQLDRPDLSIDEARAEIVALHELTLERAERVPTAIMDVIEPPNMPDVELPSGPPYEVSVYTERQWSEIKAGWASKVDTALYSNPAFNAMQMNEIRTGLENGWPAAPYAKPELSWEQMELVGKLMDQGHDVTAVMVGGSPVDFTSPALSLTDMTWLLRQMEYDAIPKMLYTPEQWAEIRQGMDSGLDVKQYADPKIPAGDMAKLRDALERGLVIRGVPDTEVTADGAGTELHQPESSSMLPDAPEQALDEYPMPEPALTYADLSASGYLDDDMLPLSKNRALELFEQDLTIYTILDGGEASMAFDRVDIEEHGGIFAVLQEEWEESTAFYDAIEDRKNHQAERETAFLQTSTDAFAIYQPKGIDRYGENRGEILRSINGPDQALSQETYDLIYTATLFGADSPGEQLDMIWNQFRHYPPSDYHNPSISDGDIVALKQKGVVTCYYCDDSGFKELPGFLSSDNPLKNAEMAQEDDYNMIDGIINNGPTQPTVADYEAQVKAGGQISLCGLAEAIHRENGEEKKSVVERLKTQPPQQERKKTAPKKSAEREI